MRRGHFVLIFVILFAISLINFILDQSKYRKVLEERQRIESAFTAATELASEELALGLEQNAENVLINISSSFFTALSANMNYFDEEDLAAEESLYVPLLVVVGEEGFYLCILEREVKDSETILSRRWTECIPYTYIDDVYIYTLTLDGKIKSVRKEDGEIIKTDYQSIEKSASLQAYYSSGTLWGKHDFESLLYSSVVTSVEKHVSMVLAEQSYIVGSSGMYISYTCPSFLDVIPRDAVGTVIALYQGIPSTVDTGIEYSGMKTASYLKEADRYYVGESDSYYMLAHRKDCMELEGTEIGPLSSEEAISGYGAYGCPLCISQMEGFCSPP